MKVYLSFYDSDERKCFVCDYLSIYCDNLYLFEEGHKEILCLPLSDIKCLLI